MSLARNKLLWSLSFGHFLTDLYPNVLPMAFPIFMASLHLSYTGVAFIATMYTMSSSLSQPFFGYLADRFGSRLLAPIGIAWVATLTGVLGYVNEYVPLVIVATLAGLGSGAFHPQGAMNASLMSPERKATAVAVFMLGGNFGFSLGPVVAAALFASFGLGGTALLTIPGLLGAAWLLRAMRAVDEHRKNLSTDATTKAERVRVPIIGVASLVVLIMLRSWAQGGISNFTPLLYQERGFSLETSSHVLFVMLAGVAAGSIIGGILADSIGRKQVTFASLVLLSPVAYVFLQTVPPFSFVVALPLGILLGATFGITLVMIQEMMPQSLGMASGLALGLAFVTSGIGVSLTGIMADNYGLPGALAFLTILPFISALLVLNYRPVVKTVAQT